MILIVRWRQRQVGSARLGSTHMRWGLVARERVTGSNPVFRSICGLRVEPKWRNW